MKLKLTIEYSTPTSNIQDEFVKLLLENNRIYNIRHKQEEIIEIDKTMTTDDVKLTYINKLNPSKVHAVTLTPISEMEDFRNE